MAREAAAGGLLADGVVSDSHEGGAAKEVLHSEDLGNEVADRRAEEPMNFVGWKRLLRSPRL
jgi:hypothetical protein